MKKSLLGGGAATAVALLSASLIFYAKPSVAETLAEAPSQEPQTQQQQKSDAARVNAPNEAAKPIEDPATDGAGDAISKGKNNKALQAALPSDDRAVVPSRPNAALQLPSLSFVATAYSLRGRTASGRYTTKGIIAADRKVLPLGTRVRLEAGAYSGEYLVADTGGAIRGRKIDIWVPSTGEAMRFGRRSVKLTVLAHARSGTSRRNAR